MPFSSEKQRKAFFAGLKNKHSNSLKISKDGKKLEYKAKRMFGTTENPYNCGFITTNGECINFPLGQMSYDKSHSNIRQIGTNENDFISKTGNIRSQITHDNASFEIRKKPTARQLQTIKNSTENFPFRKIFADYTASNGKVLKSGSFDDFNEFNKWINENVRN